MRRARQGLLVAIMALAATGSQAAEASPGAVAVLAGGCATCHGPQGRSPGPMPSIAGLPAPVLIAQLAAFRADEIPGTTVMNRIAKGFSPAELELVAAYFAAVPN